MIELFVPQLVSNRLAIRIKINTDTRTHTHTECNMRDSIILDEMFTSIKRCTIEKSLLFEIHTFGFAFPFIRCTTSAIESKISRNTYHHTRYL